MEAWIKVRSNLSRNPKVVRLHVLLNIPISTVIGACVMLWALADEQTSDGRLRGYTFNVLDGMVGVAGFGQALARADVDWAREEEWGVLVPRFDRHNGESAKKRVQTAKRASRFRNAGSVTRESESSRSHNAGSVTKSAPRARSRGQRAEEEEEKKRAMQQGALLDARAAREDIAHCPNPAPDADVPRPRGTAGNDAVRDIAARITLGGLYDPPTAKAIAKALVGRKKITPLDQLAWALETMTLRAKSEEIGNPGAYFRSLLLEQTAPPEWVHAHRRKTLEEME